MSEPIVDRFITYGRNGVLTWGMAVAAAPGEDESGDLGVLRPCGCGILVAVIDGAGHGLEAMAASRTAAGILETFAHESPLSLVLRCHEGLRSTRGVVMTLALIDVRDQTLTWLGVGNVDAVLFRAADAGASPERLLLRPGVLGYQLPALRAEVLQLRPFDTLILATDGIRPDFAEQPRLNRTPQRIADDILARHSKGTDDALVMVARYPDGETT